MIDKEPITENQTQLSDSTKKSNLRKIFDFVKEWGGIATIAIALLYTFPLGVIDRIVNKEEQAIAHENRATSEVRQAISEMSSLRAEKLTKQIASQDPRYQNELSSTFDIRIYNIIYSKKELFRKWANKLRSSEIYAIGSSLSLIGEVEDSLFYYELAIEKAKIEKRPSTEITILRERGYSLFSDSPAQNIANARKDYYKILQILSSSKSYWPARQYVIFLSELSSFELLFGDWSCGESLKAYVVPLFEVKFQNDQVLLPYYAMFQQNISSFKRKEGQKVEGCSDKLPMLL